MIFRSGSLAGAGLAAAILLTACGDMKVKVWPFGGDSAIQERSRIPANATEYLCGGGKRIYLRLLEGGAAAWLILPERELRLDRMGAEGTRYSKGNTLLQLNGSEATLSDGAATPAVNCRTGGNEPPAPGSGRAPAPDPAPGPG